MTDIKISIVTNRPPLPPSAPDPIRKITVPETGRFMQLVEDYKTAKWQYKPRSIALNYKGGGPTDLYKGLPATVQTQKLFHALTEPWQQFLYAAYHKACFSALSEAEILEGWRKSTRDSAGQFDRHTHDYQDRGDPDPKLHTDYILGLNFNSKFGDKAQQDLLHSRNIIKVVSETATHYYYEALDVKKPPPLIDETWGKWWLVSWVTVSSVFPIGVKEWATIRFPNMRNYGVPHLVVGRNGVNRVEKFWCQPVENGRVLDLYTG